MKMTGNAAAILSLWTSRTVPAKLEHLHWVAKNCILDKTVKHSKLDVRIKFTLQTLSSHKDQYAKVCFTSETNLCSVTMNNQVIGMCCNVTSLSNNPKNTLLGINCTE